MARRRKNTRVSGPDYRDIPTNKDGTVKVEYLRQLHEARSNRSRMIDDGRTAARVYPIHMTPEQAMAWIRRPGRSDISGIDTKVPANVKFGKRKNTAGTEKPAEKKKPVVEKPAVEPGGWTVKKKPGFRWGQKGSLENTDRYRASERAFQRAEETGDEEEMYRAAYDMYKLEQIEKETHEIDIPEMIAYLEDCGFDDEVIDTSDVNWRKKPWLIREEYAKHKAADARMADIDMRMALGMSYNPKPRRRFWRRH